MRKFSFAHETVLLYLFNTYCSNFYGSQIWLRKRNCLGHFNDFGKAYHKALKRILEIPDYASNHETCNENDFFTFHHKINYDLIRTTYKIISNPCSFVYTNYFFFKHKSLISETVKEILLYDYLMTSFLDNDLDAIKSRIKFIQLSETM